MKFKNLEIPDIKIIEPEIFIDDRGYFFESFNEDQFSSVVNDQISFVQDNQSFSKKNVLRGLHFQTPPMGQGKLVRVITGEVFDVAVDLRKSSNTYGKWVSHILNGEKNEQMWIPEGFAHGFYCLKDSIFQYKTTKLYSAKNESSIKWNDSLLSIEWPIGKYKPKISQKDERSELFDFSKNYFF